MQKTPIYLSASLMAFYRFALLFAFMLSIASIFTGIGFGLFTYFDSEISFASAMYEGFLLFLKGSGIAAVISFVSFLAFWKKHQIDYKNCMQSDENNCNKIGFFQFA